MAATRRECAPPGLCPDGTTPRDPGFNHCDRSSVARACTASGDWVDVPSPQPAPVSCSVRGVANGGVRPPAECMEGTGWRSLVCATCEPFLSASGVCLESCVDDSACTPGLHCTAGGCHAPSNGNPCDVDSECDSGRCDGTCQPQLAAGQTCDETSDCDVGACSNAVCCGSAPCCNAGSAASVCGAYTCDLGAFSCHATCTANSNATCASGFHCFAGNNKCLSNADGSACDSAADCDSGYCNPSSVCATSLIGRVEVGCNTGVGGGGGPFKVARVLPTGTILAEVSGSSTLALYQTMNQSLPLNTNLTPGSFFALVGGEGSAPVSCTLKAFRPSPASNTQVGNVVPFGPLSSDQIIRNLNGGTPDTFTLFAFDGVQVTSSQVMAP